MAQGAREAMERRIETEYLEAAARLKGLPLDPRALDSYLKARRVAIRVRVAREMAQNGGE
jgi:hypothetical protein